MAQGKKSFVFYNDWGEIFKALPKSKGYDLLIHLLAYVNDENPQTKDVLVKSTFASIKNQLKRDLIKWDELKEKRIESGRKGGLRRAENMKQKQAPLSETKQSLANQAVNVNVNVNGNVLYKKKEGFKKTLIPFVEKYGINMISAFSSYWTEHNLNGKKMRFEYSKNQPFDISRRLSTWFKNQEKYKKEKSSAKKEKIDSAILLQQDYGIHK